MKRRCPSIDLTPQFFFSLPTLNRHICTHLMFDMKLIYLNCGLKQIISAGPSMLLAPRQWQRKRHEKPICLNGNRILSCLFLVVVECLNLGRKIKCFYFVSAYFKRVGFHIKDETLRCQYLLTMSNVALWAFAVTL